MEKGYTSQAKAAALVGLAAATFGKIERGETVRPNNWRQIALAFDIPIDEADELMNLDALDAGKASKLTADIQPAQPIVPRRAFKGVSPGKTPVLGYAAAGDPDRLVMLADIVDQIDTPYQLIGVEGAYALYVYGTSMIPRYYPGELVFVHPKKPLTANCFCVVQVGAGAPEGAFIKQFKSWNDILTVAQFNPAEDITFTSDEIFDVHRIVGAGDD
ncbi:S24 family peptidase [Falsochrobactrum shanghaiense]|uniref:S24 family peptidase n=1 Tax=Falsochrobactrum shanghaiense TaxID=2201899 RepID=UPI001304C5A1